MNNNTDSRNNQTSFFGRNIDILGIRIPVWFILVIIILIICVIVFAWPSNGSSGSRTQSMFPAFELDTITSVDTPGNTAVDALIRGNYY